MIGNNHFATIVFDLDDMIFIIHVISLANLDPTHLFYRAQIAFLKTDKAFIAIYFKYAYFADAFGVILTIEFLEYFEISNHVIELIDGKQPPY